jgi:hypothetical protein
MYIPREADCGRIGSAELQQISAKATAASENWISKIIELPAIENGMPGRNGQRKPGTTQRVA